MDTLLITDLDAIAHIGVKEDERSVPQILLINVKAIADFNKAAHSDCVEDTNSYSAIAKRIKKIVSETRYHLLEALAHHILRELFQTFDLKEITIRIEKPHRVANTRLVGIEMTRKAEGFS